MSAHAPEQSTGIWRGSLAPTLPGPPPAAKSPLAAVRVEDTTFQTFEISTSPSLREVSQNFHLTIHSVDSHESQPSFLAKHSPPYAPQGEYDELG